MQHCWANAAPPVEVLAVRFVAPPRTYRRALAPASRAQAQALPSLQPTKNRARVTYTTYKNQVSVLELASLLSWVSPAQGRSDSSMRQLHFRKWANPSDEDVKLLQKALDSSIAVVAAFSRSTTVAAYESGALVEDQASDWPRLIEKQPTQLVGFARAIGDRSLVATVYDVAVHPALHKQGIGRHMVQLLVNQLQMQGIYDIGLVTSPESQHFFSKCSFEPDREGSTPMSFAGSMGDAYVFSQQLQDRRSLKELLRGKLGVD